MDPTVENKKGVPSKTGIIIIALLIVLIVVAVVGIFLMRGNSKEDNMTIKYAADAGVVMDQASLQAAMDEAAANAANGNVALHYVNDAYSENGIDFECLIANSTGNAYDMYLQIFANAELTDEIFMSGLIPPGSGYEKISLEHALNPGVTTVYVVLTQVETSEGGAQTIVNQIVHTMDFHVEESAGN